VVDLLIIVLFDAVAFMNVRSMMDCCPVFDWHVIVQSL
jgi:hypothetical protein